MIPRFENDMQFLDQSEGSEKDFEQREDNHESQDERKSEEIVVESSWSSLLADLKSEEIDLAKSSKMRLAHYESELVEEEEAEEEKDEQKAEKDIEEECDDGKWLITPLRED